MAYDETDDQDVTRIARPPAIPALALRGLNVPAPEAAPPAPAAMGSTQDLEAKAAKPMMGTAMAAPPKPPSMLDQRRTRDEGELQRLNQTGSGISQIAKAHPIGGGILRGLDIAGSLAVPGLMQRIPGTELHHQQLVNREQKNVSGDINEQGKEAQTNEANARTAGMPGEDELRQAQAEKARADAEAVRNPQPKPKEEEWTVLPNMTGPNGEAVQQEKTSGQVRFAELPGGVKPIKETNENDKTKDIADTLQAHGWPDDAKHRDMARTEIAKRSPAARIDVTPPKEEGNYVPVTDNKGNTVGWVNPKSGHFKSASEIPGVVQAAGGQGALPAKPTMQMRNVNAQAKVAVEGIDPTITEINSLASELGPVEGRWSAYMQGNVGMDNPKLAGLRADLLMLSSAVALAHARGRLPENLREEFDRAINAPKQTAGNLVSVLQHIKPWMQRMTEMGQEGAGASISVKAPNGKTYTFSDQKAADTFKQKAGIK